MIEDVSVFMYLGSHVTVEWGGFAEEVGYRVGGSRIPGVVKDLLRGKKVEYGNKKRCVRELDRADNVI